MLIKFSSRAGDESQPDVVAGPVPSLIAKGWFEKSHGFIDDGVAQGFGDPFEDSAAEGG